GGAAQAKALVFTAALGGHAQPTNTGSDATGKARIVVDTDARTVDVDLDVTGITLDELWRPLAASPMGPIHLHLYGSHDHSDPNSASLLFPLPMGPSYAATAKGFHVATHAAPYAAGAAIVKTDASFEAFVAAMQSGRVVLNIHTDTEHDGEISGEVVPAS